MWQLPVTHHRTCTECLVCQVGRVRNRRRRRRRRRHLEGGKGAHPARTSHTHPSPFHPKGSPKSPPSLSPNLSQPRFSSPTPLTIRCSILHAPLDPSTACDPCILAILQGWIYQPTYFSTLGISNYPAMEGTDELLGKEVLPLFEPSIFNRPPLTFFFSSIRIRTDTVYR